MMKIFAKQDNRKGVAGMELFIEVLSTVFVAGILIFAFFLMGSKISEQDSIYETLSYDLTNATTITVVNHTAGAYPTGVLPTERNCALTITYATNNSGVSDPSQPFASGNYTVFNGCYINYTGTTKEGEINETLWNISGSWSYDYSASAIIINETAYDVAEAREWFPLFIIFTAIVVLILLVVMIIRTIKGSGLMGSEGMGSRESA